MPFNSVRQLISLSHKRRLTVLLRRVLLPISPQVTLLGQAIKAVAAVQRRATVAGQRSPGNISAITTRAGKQRIERHREIEPLIEATFTEVVAGIGPGAPGANPYARGELPGEIQRRAPVAGKVAAHA